MTLLSRRAPSVQYPLRRSRVLGALLLALLFTGAGVVAAWMSSGARDAVVSAAVALGLWLSAAAGAAHFWRSQPRGVLQFNGQTWTLGQTAKSFSGPLALSTPPEVLLDLQAHLWVRVVPMGHASQWLWLQRSSQPERWMDLRRAVYSRARSGVNNADETARQAVAGRES